MAMHKKFSSSVGCLPQKSICWSLNLFWHIRVLMDKHSKKTTRWPQNTSFRICYSLFVANGMLGTRRQCVNKYETLLCSIQYLPTRVCIIDSHLLAYFDTQQLRKFWFVRFFLSMCWHVFLLLALYDPAQWLASCQDGAVLLARDYPLFPARK